MRWSTVTQKLAEAAEAGVVFVGEHCLHARDRASECEACFAICPADAIQPSKPPHFDKEACQNCLACLPVCPSNAYAFKGTDTAGAILSAVKKMDVRRCELLCSLHPAPTHGVGEDEVGIRVRGCLAGLGTAIYLSLGGLGMEAIRVRVDACAGCRWSQLKMRVTEQVKQAQALLALWGRSQLVTLVEGEAPGRFKERPLWNAEAPPRTRRDFFRPARSETQTEDADAGSFPQRRRALRAFSLLGKPEPEADLSTPLVGLDFALVAVTDACTACGTCARACPTGAIRFETDSSRFELYFSPWLCISCDVCTHVCAPAAVTLSRDPSFEQVIGSGEDLLLLEGPLGRCRGCGAPYAAREGMTLCPVCDFRRQNPFGSWQPPGLTRLHTSGARVAGSQGTDPRQGSKRHERPNS